MGYVTDATTLYLDLHITERGRKFLLEGSLADQIVKFALGDSDKDYMNSENLPGGYVPDVTGSHNNCIFGVNNGYTIKDKITYLPGGLNVLATMSEAKMVFGSKSQGTTVWANNANLKVFLHDYVTIFKVLALQNSIYHSFGGINMKNTFASYFNNIFDSTGAAWGTNMGSFWDTIQETGRDQNLHILDNIFKNVGGAYVPTSVNLTLIGNNSKLLFKSLFGSVTINESGQPVTDDGPSLAKTIIPSPFSLTNSIFTDNENKTWPGAGPMGITVGTAYDWGYSVSRLIANTPFYQEYGLNNKAGGFYNINQAQNPSLNKTLFNSVEGADLNTIIPALRLIRPANHNTNYYYIPQTNQIDVAGNAHFTSESGPSFEGMAATTSTAAWDSWGIFAAGTAEYETVAWGNGFDKKFKVMQPDTALEPRTLVTTLLQDIINFFAVLSKDSKIGQLVHVTGSKADNTDKVFTVPMTFQASDATDPNVKSGTIKVEFILSVPALLQSFTRDAATATTPIRYRALATNQTVARFYGAAALVGFPEFTPDPTHFTTSGATGYKTFIDFNSL